tara:strand:- start:46 stop:252 length:207 start_codon:yes stop_codon:yes gene_type:complete
MDNIYNYLYYDFSNDKLFINNIVIPKLENKIKQLESINKDKTEYSTDIKESIRAKNLIILSLRYFYKI